MPSLRVSGVIACHNHACWVNEAIDSMAGQGHRPVRIVVVDDGSSDGSFAAVADRLYRPQLGRLSWPGSSEQPVVVSGKLTNWQVDVLVVRLERAHGPSYARNLGIRCAWPDSDLFALLDSDDRYEPGKIARSVECFADDRVAVVYSDYDTLRPDGLRLRQYKEPFSRARLVQECIVNCDSLLSKQALEACGGFDEQLRVVEDYDLWLRLSEKFLLVHLAEPLVTIRVGQHSSTDTVSKETWQRCYNRVMQKARERMALA